MMLHKIQVGNLSNTTSQVALPIVEMDCPTCAATIEKELKKLDGVTDARVNFMMKKVIVDYDPRKTGVPELEEKLEYLGYQLSYKKYEGFIERFSKVLFGKKDEIKFRQISDHEFDNLVLKSNKPVAMLFLSQICSSCKALKPRLKTVLNKFQGQIYFYEIDISKTKKWEDYNILSIPTLMFFKDGKTIGRLVSLPRIEQIEQMTLKTLED